MTKIRLYKNPNGFICGFLASGHASGEQAGSNIYCAAVSAITQTAAIGLEEVAKVKTDIKMQSGKLSVMIDENDASNEKCRTIFETMLAGLASFDEVNPNHIQIIEEVQ